ncbi:MAG TPA: glycosyltransferase family 4 protein [Candidatus Methylomirabilis sp.]|nr:glycosyltransferase family 4 protein [Candidatus Methylomirabilis sp.]
MRILIATGVRRKKEAGAAGVVLNHAAELSRRGHAVECWFLEDVLERPVKPRFEALLFARAVSRRIQKEPGKYDVVNLHAPWGCAYGVGRRWFGARDLPPYVLTMQGSEEQYVQAMRLEQRKGRAWNFSWKNRVWQRIYHQTMYDYSIKTADYGAVANREARVCTELKYKREPGRISYVPNGTEQRFFISREFPEKQGLNLLFVGTWLDRKGIYYLADAFGLLAKKNPEMRLTVAGCAAVDEQVRSLFPTEVRDRVEVIPFVKREEILGIYQAHDVFVFPSLVEGMPLTLLEAMATAMPAVTTNTCGMADVVEDEFNGLLVPPADGGRLAAAVQRLRDSADLRRRLGLAAQETMRRYTWERVTRGLETVLKMAAENGQR